MAKKKDDIYSVIRLHCNNCGHETVHDVLEGRNFGIWETLANGREHCVGDDMWLVVMCQGCGHKGFARHQDHYDTGCQTDIYPPQVIRRVPHWYYLSLVTLDGDVLELFGEVYTALQNSAYRLAAMGIRAAFEHIFVEKVGDHGSFQGNLNAFQEGGFISSIERNSVMAVLEVGHAAIHRSHNPSIQDVLSMLDILEHLIQALYVNEQLAQSLAKVPERLPLAKKIPKKDRNIS